MKENKFLYSVLKIMYILIELAILYKIVKFALYYETIAKIMLVFDYLNIVYLNSVLYYVEISINNNNYKDRMAIVCNIILICMLIGTFISCLTIDLALVCLMVGISLGIAILVISIINSKTKIALILRMLIIVISFTFILI